MKKIILSTLTFLCAFTAFAIAQKEVKPDNLVIKKNGKEVDVTFTVKADTKTTSANYKLLLTPVLYNGVKELSLKQIVFESRRTRIIDRRNGIPPMKNTYSAEYGQTIEYATHVPYEEWMHGASFRIDQLKEGCCSEELLATDLVKNLALTPDEIPVYQVQMQYSYVKPEAEVPKFRHEIGTAYVEFRQGSAVLLADFRSNQAELSKIQKSIEWVKKEEGTTITGIKLFGSCSPEATWNFNARLAAERANTVKSYIYTRYKVQPDIIEVESIPEDWNLFQKLMEESTLPERDAILAIINSDKDPDVKNAELSKMPVYTDLMKNVYPFLRKVDYEVKYSVKGFDLEQSKRVLETTPKNLSLIEFYVIANSYPVGSHEFNRAFELAAREFPEDEVAGMNAAVMALKQGNVSQAEYYLRKIKLSGSGSPQYNNVLGVVATLKGEYSTAKSYLEKAAQAGLTEAVVNLDELKKKVTNKDAIEEREKTLNL